MSKIYESPDKGKTVYSREFGKEDKNLEVRVKSDPGGVGWSLQDALRLSEQYKVWKEILAHSYDDPYIRDLVEKIEIYYELKYK